jgi:hypothetical protein
MLETYGTTRLKIVDYDSMIGEHVGVNSDMDLRLGNMLELTQIWI